jgi:hypothetical protein
VVPGQPVLRLVAVGADGRRALAAALVALFRVESIAQSRGSSSGQVSTSCSKRVMPLIRLTGKRSRYGVSRFNLRTGSVANSTGDILASGVEAAGDDWARV